MVGFPNFAASLLKFLNSKSVRGLCYNLGFLDHNELKGMELAFQGFYISTSNTKQNVTTIMII